MQSLFWCDDDVVCIRTELANSNKPEQEDTLPKDNECSSESHFSADVQGVNDNEVTDENKNPSSRGDNLFSAHFCTSCLLLFTFINLEDDKF